MRVIGDAGHNIKKMWQIYWWRIIIHAAESVRLRGAGIYCCLEWILGPEENKEEICLVRKCV